VVVLYSTDTATSNELAYRTKAGTSACGTANWSSATNLTSARTNGKVQWVKMAWDRRSTSDLITAIWADEASALSASVWSGSAWGNEPSAALETSLEVVSAAQDVDDFDVEYESVSGDVMVAWANSVGANGTNGLRYATCTGGVSNCTWSAATNPAPAGADDATNLDLSANPTSDELVLGMLGDADDDLWAGYWSAAAWAFSTNLDTTASTSSAAGKHLVSTGWLVSGAMARSVIVYFDGDGTTTNVSYYTGTGATFSAGTDFTPTPTPGAQQWLDIDTDPFNRDRLMLTDGDASSDVMAKRLVMDATPTFTWTNADGGTALETNLAQATADDFSFAYWRHPPSYTQSAYRWYANADSVTPGSSVANENTAPTLAPSAVRLRTQLSVSQQSVAVSNQRFKLQYATSTSGPWSDVGEAGAWCNTVSPACNTGWVARRKIILDNSLSATNLTNFPILVKLDSTNIDYTKTQNNGEDLRFTDSDGTALNYEIEKWDESGTSYVWVRVPQVDASSSGDYIWMYYNNAGASTGSSTANTNAVWDSNYQAVFHMKESPAGGAGAVKDSTSNARNATSSGSMTAGDLVTAAIGDGIDFDGTDDYLDVPYTNSLSSATVEVWAKSPAAPVTSNDTNLVFHGNNFQLLWDSSAAGCAGSAYGRFSLTGYCASANPLPANSFTYMVGTYANNSLKAYRDGTLVTSSSAGSGPDTESTDVLIGGGNGPFIGVIDEVRISDTVRSADWLRAQSLTMTGRYETFGSEQGQSPTWKYKDNSTPANGATIPTTLLSGSDVTCSYAEANPTAVNPNTVLVGQTCEWDFALDATTTPNGTYYFRMVRSDGAALSTYSVYPQVAIAPPNTAPSSPSSLAQTTTADVVLNTGAWHNSTSVKFTATVSDPDAADTDAICVEATPITQAFTDTEDTCGTAVAQGSTASVTLTLTDATEYHWQARTKDAGGLYSSWVSYAANSDVVTAARDVGIDTTPAATGSAVVYDGSNAGVDAAFNDGSLDSLSANWSGFDANVSGLANYQYAVGTSAGGTDLVDWTDNGTVTSITVNSLSLHTGQLYFVSVRAVDGAGNTSAAVSSNGQLVAPTLTFTVSSNAVNFTLSMPATPSPTPKPSRSPRPPTAMAAI
jgi:hypothetical protein